MQTYAGKYLLCSSSVVLSKDQSGINVAYAVVHKALRFCGPVAKFCEGTGMLRAASS